MRRANEDEIVRGAKVSVIYRKRVGNVGEDGELRIVYRNVSSRIYWVDV